MSPESVERVDPATSGSPWREEHLARYREMVRRGGAAGTVLDVACGTGSGSALLLEHGAHRLIAADRAGGAVATAHDRLAGFGEQSPSEQSPSEQRPSEQGPFERTGEERAGAEHQEQRPGERRPGEKRVGEECAGEGRAGEEGGPGAFFLAIRCDGTRLPVATRTVDAVACFETLEHVDDDEAFLAELHRVLRVGGRLFLSTPNALVTNPEGGAPANPYHVREYEPGVLDRRVEPYFEREWAGGQHVPEGYGPAPFLPSFRRNELGFADRWRFLRWRIFLRMPALRDAMHRAATGYPFYPGVDDYTFRERDRERAHVQYLVLRRRSRVHRGEAHVHRREGAAKAGRSDTGDRR